MLQSEPKIHMTNETIVERWERAYRMLDTPFDASPTAIRSAYLRKVKTYHPDLFPTDHERQVRANEHLSKVNSAYALVEEAPLQYFQCPQIEWIRHDDDRETTPSHDAEGRGFPWEPTGAPRFASISILSGNDSLLLVTRIVKFCFGIFLTLPLAVAAMESTIWLAPAVVAALLSGFWFAKLQQDTWIALSRPFWR